MKHDKPPRRQVEPEHNPSLKIAIMEMVDNQLRDNNPPETKQTYDRLMTEGFSEQHVRELIAAAVTNEINEILKKQEPFDRVRFAATLKRLPKLPWDD